MDEKLIVFLERLAKHIEGIDHNCGHCISNFLECGEFDYDLEEYRGGVNALLKEFWPSLQFKHIRGVGIKPDTVELVKEG
jgi:hypothetical protein